MKTWDYPNGEGHLECPACGRFRNDGPSLPTHCPAGHTMEYPTACRSCDREIEFKPTMRLCPECGRNPWKKELHEMLLLLVMVAVAVVTVGGLFLLWLYMRRLAIPTR